MCGKQKSIFDYMCSWFTVTQNKERDCVQSIMIAWKDVYGCKHPKNINSFDKFLGNPTFIISNIKA